VDFTLSQLVVWLVVGALIGALLGATIRRKAKGYSPWSNLLVGLVGAVIGGLVWRLFKIDLGLGAVSVSVEDLVGALLGAIAFLVVLFFVRKKDAKPQA